MRFTIVFIAIFVIISLAVGNPIGNKLLKFGISKP